MHARQVPDVHEEERAPSHLHGKGLPPLSRKEANGEQRQNRKARPTMAGDVVIQDQGPDHCQQKPDGPEHLYAEDGARKGPAPVQRSHEAVLHDAQPPALPRRAHRTPKPKEHETAQSA